MAPVLYRALCAVRSMAFNHPVAAALAEGMRMLATEPAVRPDYLTIAHSDTLQPLTDWQGVDQAVALVAAQVGPVRLIDNITLSR